MTYFANLRKREPEPEPEEAVEEPAVEDEETEEEQPAARGPLLTGLFGPGQWLAAHFGTGVAWGVHVVAVWAVGFYGGWTAVGVIAVWLFLVVLFTPSEALDRASGWLEGLFTPRPKASAPPAPGGEREAVLRLLLDAMGEADKVHLNTVLAHLQKCGQWEGRTVTDMRSRLTLLNIPHDRNVKVAGVPTWGVRRAALEAPSPSEETAPSPAPSPPV